MTSIITVLLKRLFKFSVLYEYYCCFPMYVIISLKLLLSNCKDIYLLRYYWFYFFCCIGERENIDQYAMSSYEKGNSKLFNLINLDMTFSFLSNYHLFKIVFLLCLFSFPHYRWSVLIICSPTEPKGTQLEHVISLLGLF